MRQFLSKAAYAMEFKQILIKFLIPREIYETVAKSRYALNIIYVQCHRVISQAQRVLPERINHCRLTRKIFSPEAS